MKWLASLTLALLAVFVLALAWHQSLFSEYSRDFGRLPQAQFHAMNARMDLLGAVAHSAYLPLLAVNWALVVVAARKRALVVCGLAALLALALTLFALFALASVGPAMIG